MSEPEDFLSRWSRRKRVADLEKNRPVETETTTPEQKNKKGQKHRSAHASAENSAPEPAFDRARLPSLDSIGAQTDISVFLKPGVPNELRLAALRCAWTMDPAVRDFKGLQENDWNFNDPNGILGFGELDPSFDVKKMVTNLFGETPRPHDSRPEALEAAGQPTPPCPNTNTPAAHDPVATSTLDSENCQSHRKTATHDRLVPPPEDQIVTGSDGMEVDMRIKRRRSHGSALPR